MTDQKKNILIGLFVMGAVSILIALVLFLKPTVGDGKKILQVRFANIGGVTVGTRVTFAGKPVGEVVKIKELPNARDEIDEQGRIFLYELSLKIDSKVDVYTTDEINIKTNGLMGERSVAIVPKMAPQTQLVKSQILYASSADPLETAFNQVSRVSTAIETAVRRVDVWFAENQKYLSNAIQSFDALMSQVDTLVPPVKESLSLLNDNMQLVKNGLEDDQLLHKCASLADSLDQAVTSFNSDGAQTLRNFNQISRDIASGSGTVGRLIVGDDLYLRVASLMNKGETLMNDINHYGILFQYNKQWQKNRTKKANLLRSLDNPQEFKSYFEGEIDTMTTSLGRLTELVDRSRGQIAQNDAFKRDFAALMRQVQGLSDSLKLYNEGMLAESEGVEP
jgi:phospholipid/cholesterol/gamma-HCH transport system substrate-binding protein